MSVTSNGPYTDFDFVSDIDINWNSFKSDIESRWCGALVKSTKHLKARKVASAVIRLKSGTSLEGSTQFFYDHLIKYNDSIENVW